MTITCRLTPTDSSAELTLREAAAAQDAKRRLVLTEAELRANGLIINAFLNRSRS